MSVEDKHRRKMTYVRLGNSGLKVSRLILGLMSYGQKEWGMGLGRGGSIKHIKAAYDAGIQTFDTADVYSNGESERILGKAIKQLNLPRDEIVVMTKVFNIVRREPGPFLPTVRGDSPQADALGYTNQYGLSRKAHSSMASCLSIANQCHRFDYQTPIAETMQALHDVVKAGYARYIGMSSCHAYQFHAMQNYAINNGLTPFIAMQNQYNLVYREEEREMIPTLKMFGVGMIPWSPLSQGILSRPYEETTLRAQTSHSAQLWKKRKKTTKKSSFEDSKARDISMAQVAVAWCLSKDVVTAPIVGTTSLANLQDLIGGLDVTLTEDEIKQIEEPYGVTQLAGHNLGLGEHLVDCPINHVIVSLHFTALEILRAHCFAAQTEGSVNRVYFVHFLATALYYQFDRFSRLDTTVDLPPTRPPANVPTLQNIYPSTMCPLDGSAFCSWFFALTTTGHLFQAVTLKTTYMIPTLVLCGVGELLGWAGRYWGHVNPHNGDAFMMQITTTIIAPSFMTAAMFLILPKIINELGTMYSRMPPRLYSIIFITADVTALIIQAAGGPWPLLHVLRKAQREEEKLCLAASSSSSVIAVILYTILGLEFVIRFSYDRPAHPKIISDLRKNSGWVGVPRGIVKMLTGLAIATVFIIIRSILPYYRTYRWMERDDHLHRELFQLV
ncbi:Aldo kereductase [Rhizoctonia solani]|uniref:Aldo kereductase n=1 Tax=Rhizoctonia solani TaxID=456999 RepID=A0A8H7IDR9_9AGAM|nr:Aldo kereductase [Rhizoctonia solani]